MVLNRCAVWTQAHKNGVVILKYLPNRRLSKVLSPEGWVHVGFIIFVLTAGVMFRYSSQPRNAHSVPTTDYSVPRGGNWPDWSRSPATFVIAVRKDCPYCESSRPFYSKLLEMARQRKIGPRLIFASPDDELAGARFWPAGATVLSHVNLRAIGVSGTPTIIEIDQHSRVVKAWQGRLPPDSEQEVISAVRSAQLSAHSEQLIL
jgi:hypothetical protein